LLFSSIPFVFLFLPLSLVGYFLCVKFLAPSGKLVWLALASVGFYAYWRVDYLPILLGSIVVNFAIASAIQIQVERSGSRQKLAYFLLFIGVAFNLGLLGYFKYFDFLIETTNATIGSHISTFDLVLPLAISFFTFQQIAYLVDSYKGATVRGSFLNYFVFVTFFPQLIAGPIVHHREMMPQFMRKSLGVFRWKNLLIGLTIFSLGLFKKIVLADQFAVYADLGYADFQNMSVIDAWLTTLSYTFQLYFDFSGYSDMAIGAARMFGIVLPLNFFSPYKATSIQQFWRRWHMTLSRFLKEFVYVPLGGNRRSETRVNLNLFATFVLGGIWHGAGWTFILWGAIHGIALVIGRAFGKFGIALPRTLNWLMTFLTVHIAWVFFRSENFPQAISILKTLFGVDVPDGPSNIVIMENETASLYLLAAFVIVLAMPNTSEFTRDVRSKRKVVFAALLFGVACTTMLASSSEVFLYYNF
jgi:alginate O-acetyltransferase complex protein AlgI